MGNVVKVSSKQIWMDRTTSQFNEDSMKNYYEESDEGYFLESEVQYPERLQKF